MDITHQPVLGTGFNQLKTHGFRWLQQGERHGGLKVLTNCQLYQVGFHELLNPGRDLFSYFIDASNWIPVSVLLMDKSSWAATGSVTAHGWAHHL